MTGPLPPANPLYPHSLWPAAVDVINDAPDSVADAIGALQSTISGVSGAPPLAFGTVSATGQFLGPLGSASAPTFSFTANPSTGVFMPVGNTLGFSAGGTDAWHISANGNMFPMTDGTQDLATGALRIRNLHAAGAVRTGGKAGAAVDGDVNNPSDGMLRYDSTNNRLYIRIAATWRYATLT